MISYNSFLSSFFFPFFLLTFRVTLARFHTRKTPILNPILHTINQWLPTNGISTRAYF